jgi:translation initiation factor IF-3
MARPPVAKLMDYGKFKYESALKARESRKNQAQTVIKEIKLRPKIDPHDYGTKKGHVERFLKQGDKVKVTIMFRGREQSRPELGFKLLQKLAADVEELGFVESTPKQDGRNMIMVIGPHKRKTEAMAAAKAERGSRSRASASQEERAHAEQAAAAAAASETTSASGAQATPATSDAAQGNARASQAASAEDAATGSPSRAEPSEAEPATAEPSEAEPARAEPSRSEQAKPAATPRPAAPRPQPRPGPAASGSAAPKPTAPRTAASPAARPGNGAAAPRPMAPRGTTAAARTSAAGAAATSARPGPARRSGDGPVPSPRTVAAEKAAKKSGSADSDSES